MEKNKSKTVQNLEEIADSSLPDEVVEILLNTREQGQMIEQLIENQIKVKDDMIEKLHSELEYYKQNQLEKFVVQLMKAVIKVRNDMSRRILEEREKPMSESELRKEYNYVFQDLTDLLEQQNVDAFSSEPGVVFDASIHQAKLEKTSDQKLDKRIKESLFEGYKKDGKLLLAEKVIVYQYKGEDK